MLGFYWEKPPNASVSAADAIKCLGINLPGEAAVCAGAWEREGAPAEHAQPFENANMWTGETTCSPPFTLWENHIYENTQKNDPVQSAR